MDTKKEFANADTNRDEAIRELSRETMASYSHKAHRDQRDAEAEWHDAAEKGQYMKGSRAMRRSDKRGQGIKRALKKMNEDHLEEGWLFGSRYKKIGNKSGSTHRITFKHIPTDSKHTVDVTAPTDRHAEAHVHRHVLGGRNGTAPIRITRVQHLHEDAEDLQELSIKKLNAYQSKATKEVRQIKSNSNYGAERAAAKLMANRIKGIARANKSRIAQSEELDETMDPRDNLPIRYAVNHPDSQASHPAREYKKSITAYNAGHAKLASQHRSPSQGFPPP